jgi:hypothetical protein
METDFSLFLIQSLSCGTWKTAGHFDIHKDDVCDRKILGLSHRTERGMRLVEEKGGVRLGKVSQSLL